MELLIGIGLFITLGILLTLPEKCKDCGGNIVDWDTKKRYCEDCGKVQG